MGFLKAQSQNRIKFALIFSYKWVQTHPKCTEILAQWGQKYSCNKAIYNYWFDSDYIC